MTRRALLGSAAALAALPAKAAPPAPTRIVELTLLKANPGERAALVRFIEMNWFAMDRIATARGLMTGYRLLSDTGDGGDWDVAVAVGYPDDRGYEGIATAFEAIRRAHVEVRVDGKSLKQLGRIVGSRRLAPGAGDGAW